MEEKTNQTETHAGLLLAHTSLIAGLIAVMKAKGLLTQEEVNGVFDSAITAAETATGLSFEAQARARRILELIGEELGGPLAPPAP